MAKIELSERAAGALKELVTSKNCDAKALAAVEAIVTSGSDFDCHKINAFRLAKAAPVERREMLKALLYATRLGIFDLNWDIHCPSCHGIPDYKKHLMGLQNVAHCALCDIDWDLDIEEQIEVTFTVNPNIRKIEYKDCSQREDFKSKMEYLDDILAREGREFAAAACVYPNETKVVGGEFAPGRYVYYMPSHAELGGVIDVSAEKSPETQNFRLEASSKGEMSVKKLSAKSGRIDFTVASSYPTMNGFLVSPVAARNNWVSAAFVTAQQDFRDLFAGEFLSVDTSFAVKNITLMFTDIKGSTSLYEAIGDSGAFSAVKEHFAVMSDIVARNEGGIVKTIGDAVMASFPVNAEAVRAACEIQKFFASGKFRSGDIRVKIGLHRGPAIAVTSNRSLDFFGRSVNIAARVQGQSRANEVLFTEQVAGDPLVEKYFSDNNISLGERTVSLKGIEKPLVVYSAAF